jgi:hypothetical protein
LLWQFEQSLNKQTNKSTNQTKKKKKKKKKTKKKKKKKKETEGCINTSNAIILHITEKTFQG